eukprot:7572513-Ditylum_brightwellii.AAC.1
MDVQLQIEETFAALNLDVIAYHVKGHQDRKVRREDKKEIEIDDKEKMTQKNLTWQAKLNIHADQLATKACKLLY